MDIAIKYEKINLGEEKYIFKPVSVIRGIYDMETDLFETEYGDCCVPIDGCMKDDDNYFGELTGIEKLSEYYPGFTEEEMLAEYYSACSDIFYLAYFDYKNTRIELLKIPFETVENVLMNQKSKKNVDNKTKITLDREEVRELRKIQDIKELHSRLDEILGNINVSKKEVNNVPLVQGKSIFKWETPYTILNIEESKYSKNELLDIVKNCINKIQIQNLNEKEKNMKIDCVLDAYNYLINESYQKTKKLR